MVRLKILVILFLFLFCKTVPGQVSVRLFSIQYPASALFSVTNGKYELTTFKGETIIITQGESVILSGFNRKLAVNTRDTKGFVCDSLVLKGKTGEDSFSLRINGKVQIRQYYTGDLKCFPDLGTLVLVNTCDIEKYIAGVVFAEGGNGKNKEYFKTQAIIARTYLYRSFNEHLSDRFNVCDNTHCQAFNGLSTDELINSATLETKGMVLLDQDSVLITSAFHSNCGGETASSEDVWLVSLPYLKKVLDPWCLSSRNAKWENHIGFNEWVRFIKKSGYKGKTDNISLFNFFQKTRLTNYKTGSFTIPLLMIRNDMNLRSTFFSVIGVGDSIILKGRGYGHGVGLCQEGAMEMASKGFNYRQIIDFYYSGVIISDMKKIPPGPPFGNFYPTGPPNGNFYPPGPPNGGKGDLLPRMEGFM